ncbi:hypothetical protein JRO89_XS04G0264200 [Xanthoceras sorbifolium]|uniref:Uncharacterized protein n=1 Tax=Xanthoceras sorbifolium TaxID=99658 RepID=A0ABQ8I781_9ROSI|nr:hypothetical protein JRO89_XS04G0264200 [Xanthoceras sorbifolium]
MDATAPEPLLVPLLCTRIRLAVPELLFTKLRHSSALRGARTGVLVRNIGDSVEQDFSQCGNIHQTPSKSVNVDERKQSIVRDGADKVDEIVYHTDYHGVTTHPNPTPKHPTP